MVTPAAVRKAVAHLRAAFEMSERRACKAIGCCRMTMRYKTTRADDARLRQRMNAIRGHATQPAPPWNQRSEAHRTVGGNRTVAFVMIDFLIGRLRAAADGEFDDGQAARHDATIGRCRRRVGITFPFNMNARG
jgi:hypothetical protein